MHKMVQKEVTPFEHMSFGIEKVDHFLITPTQNRFTHSEQ